MEPLAKYKVPGHCITETSVGDKLPYWVNSVRNWRAWVVFRYVKRGSWWL